MYGCVVVSFLWMCFVLVIAFTPFGTVVVQFCIIFFSVLSVYCFLNLPVPLYLAFFSDEFPVGFELVVLQFLSYVPCPAKVCDLQVI